VLVLTRRKNQSIVIGDGIIVTVLEVKGDQIRLGVTAPRDVPVHREELLAALAQANQAAVLPTDATLPSDPVTASSGISSAAYSKATRPALLARHRAA
jgi:carbon storage regulator